jgi:hypothetical protein
VGSWRHVLERTAFSHKLAMTVRVANHHCTKLLGRRGSSAPSYTSHNCVWPCKVTGFVRMSQCLRSTVVWCLTIETTVVTVYTTSFNTEILYLAHELRFFFVLDDSQKACQWFLLKIINWLTRNGDFSCVAWDLYCSVTEDAGFPG